MRQAVSDDRVEQRVRDALQHRADRLPARVPPFDAGAPRFAFEQDASRRRGRRALVGAVALTAAVLVPVLLVRASHRPAPLSLGSTGGSEPSTAVPSVDAPGALSTGATEGGLDLWSVTWGSSDVAADPPSRSELFGRADGTGGKVFVQISSANPGSSACCTPVTVRGQAGQVAPAKEFSDSTSTIYWQEDATVVASYNGMSQADALDFLGELTWRGADHQAGLDAPSSSGFDLFGDAQGDPSESVMTTDLSYRDAPSSLAPGQGRQVEVRTTESSARITAEYLKAWFDGERLTDGTVQSFDPAFGTLLTVQTDGRSVWIDANGTTSDAAALRRVLDDVKPIPGAQMLALRAASEARAAALPVVADATVAAGTLSLHAGQGVQSACLAVSDEAPRCTTPTEPVDAAIGSFLIDGRWYVIAAGTDSLQVTSGAGVTLPAQSATLGGLDAIVCPPPAGVDTVDVGTPQQQLGVQRPAF